MMLYMSHIMRKTYLYVKTKTQISRAVTAQLISAFICAICTVQVLFLLKPKFQASSLHRPPLRPVCVDTGWKT